MRVSVSVAIVLFAVTASVRTVDADLILSGVGVATVETFDSYRGLGLSSSPTSGQLDSNTYRARGFSDGDSEFEGNSTTGDFARGQSTGGVDEFIDDTSGAYAFEVAAGDFAVGVQPSAEDFTPGDFTIRIQNGTGQSIRAINVAGLVNFFNDGDRSTLWTFAGSLVDIEAAYVPLFFLQSPEQADMGTVAWSTDSIGQTVSLPVDLAQGARFYIKITGDDLGGSGARDEFALSYLSVTAVPEPGSTAIVGFLCGCVLLRRRKRSV